MEPYFFRPGTSPLLVSMPHVGTYIPTQVAAGMTEDALGVPDTDWHVDRLYDFLDELGASALRATYSRYVIDLNRSPEGEALYPGARNTELCPTTLFDDRPIYKPGQAPDPATIAERRELYWRPYHERLAAELAAIRARHGYVLLFDAHSIRSQVPRFFPGRLWDLNVGTADGASASPMVVEGIMAAVRQVSRYTSILNGRFKGGYITRQYGRPAERIEAIQLELSQLVYMEEDPPFRFRDDLAAQVRPVLRRAIESMLAAGAKSYRGIGVRAAEAPG
jgi:N-formylglutamate deformylase